MFVNLPCRREVPLIELDHSIDLSALDLSRVIFLDFDGVLHPDGVREHQHFCYLPNLCEVLRGVDSEGVVPIVISSLWRHTHTLESMRRKFPVDIAPRVIGVTPHMNDEAVKRILDWAPYGGPQSMYCHRQREIMTWMNSHSPQGKWLAIDDRASYFHKDEPNLYLVPKLVYQGDSGITTYQMAPLRTRLEAFLQ